MKNILFNRINYRLIKAHLKDKFDELNNQAQVGENCFIGYGFDHDEKFIWKSEYVNNFEAFQRDILQILDKYISIDKLCETNIQRETENDIYYHIDECKTSFYYMIFYKIITINNEKYLRMEFVTVPGYKDDDEYNRIKYLSLSQEMVEMGRKTYFKHRLDNISPLITSESNKEQDLNNNQVELKVVLRHDLYNNIRDVLANGLPGSCDAETAFYFCDSMINNDGKGRKELSIFDLTTETEDGDYFCYGLDRNYVYGEEHDFELLDSEPTLLDYFS